MGFWSWLTGDHAGVSANTNVSSSPPTVGGGDYTPGDPGGVEIAGEETFTRALPMPSSSPWDGWPADWSTPSWQGGVQRLVDTAWACLDLNASVLAAMPVYQLRSGRVVRPSAWMGNPDPDIYSSWAEFAKALFWDYQLGEAFVMPTDVFENGLPRTFRVVPPWFVNAEMGEGRRLYSIGGADVTDVILHIRYQSTTMDARGHGPLENSGARMVTAGVLSRYVTELAETGGVPTYWIGVEKQLQRAEAESLQEQWVTARKQRLGQPPVMSGGAELHQAQSMNARDMALLELAQFTESRIAVMLGVPPFLVGLPSGGDSMTYSNVSSLFDLHHRSSLNPKASAVMSALSNWALPRGGSVELNRDDYTRPPLRERAQAYEKLATIGAISIEEIRQMERLTGDVPEAAGSLTGVDDGG